jgi:hypothetical protein
VGKELTPSQREFINRFITGKAASEQARIVSAYQDYLRRADKVQAAIDKIRKIDSNQALLATLQQQLIDAQVKAASGDFSGAYDDLLNVKNTAKAQAKGSLAQLLPAQLGQEIDKLEWGRRYLADRACDVAQCPQAGTADGAGPAEAVHLA